MGIIFLLFLNIIPFDSCTAYSADQKHKVTGALNSKRNLHIRSNPNQEISDYIDKYEKIKIKKSEFETTESYLKRISDYGFAGQEFILTFPANHGFELKYNADSEILSIGMDGTNRESWHNVSLGNNPQFLINKSGNKVKNSYFGSNVFGVKRKVDVLERYEQLVSLHNVGVNQLVTDYNYLVTETANKEKEVKEFTEIEGLDTLLKDILIKEYQKSQSCLEQNKDKFIRTEIKVKPDMAKKIITTSLLRLYIKTVFTDNQEEFIVSADDYYDPTVNNPVEIHTIRKVILADLLKAELIDPESKKVYAIININAKDKSNIFD